MDLFSPLKLNFKNLLFNILTTERSFENCSYSSSFLLPQMMEISKNTFKRGIKSDIASIGGSGDVSQDILRSGIL